MMSVASTAPLGWVRVTGRVSSFFMASACATICWRMRSSCASSRSKLTCMSFRSAALPLAIRDEIEATKGKAADLRDMQVSRLALGGLNLIPDRLQFLLGIGALNVIGGQFDTAQLLDEPLESVGILPCFGQLLQHLHCGAGVGLGRFEVTASQRLLGSNLQLLRPA